VFFNAGIVEQITHAFYVIVDLRSVMDLTLLNTLRRARSCLDFKFNLRACLSKLTTGGTSMSQTYLMLKKSACPLI